MTDVKNKSILGKRHENKVVHRFLIVKAEVLGNYTIISIMVNALVCLP